jgi:hypothetical protein
MDVTTVFPGPQTAEIIKFHLKLKPITMKTLRRLPFVLAFVFTLFMSACTEADVNPRNTGDDDDEPIIIGGGK